MIQLTFNFGRNKNINNDMQDFEGESHSEGTFGSSSELVPHPEYGTEDFDDIEEVEYKNQKGENHASRQD